MPFLPPVVVAALIVRCQCRSISVFRINAIYPSTRRLTRCCDAQGAGAVVSRINAIARPRFGRVNREVECLSFRINAISTARRVPVVVMLRAPVP